MGLCLAIFVLGALLALGGRLGLGSLPGDLSWRRGTTAVYVPIVSSIVLSLVLTLILNLLMRLLR